MVATKVSAHGGVKAKAKKGKVSRAKSRKPEVAEVEYGPVTGLVVGAAQALDDLLTGLTYAASAAYEFMGKVFHSIYEWCASVLSWLDNQIKAAPGKVKEAFTYVRSVVSSRNIDWIAVNTVAIKALCAAAAIGVAITGGVLVGVTVGGGAVAVGASVEAGRMIAIMSSAITGGVLAEACYTFMKAGLRVDDIACARGSVLSLR